jgi:catechol 2,3-dioxygenase-like lactoylglutathione lyase family enzyme
MHTGAVPTPLDLETLCHVNAIVENYEGALAHFTRVFGAVLNFEVPDDGERRAFLFTLGDVIFEIVVPDDPLATEGRGERLRRYGNHYDGLEFSVPDVVTARRRCGELRLEIIADRGGFFYTASDDLHGISLEIFDQDWHDLLAPKSAESHGWEPVPTADFWRHDHPLGLTGLARLSVAVRDLDLAVERFGHVTRARILYRADRSSAAARAVGLRVGDTTLELLAPTGEGPLLSYLDRYGERLRSTVFMVRDLAQAERFLTQQGVTLVEGDAEGSRALAAEESLGLRFELTEEPVRLPSEV